MPLKSLDAWFYTRQNVLECPSTSGSQPQYQWSSVVVYRTEVSIYLSFHFVPRCSSPWPRQQSASWRKTASLSGWRSLTSTQRRSRSGQVRQTGPCTRTHMLLWLAGFHTHLFQFHASKMESVCFLWIIFSLLGFQSDSYITFVISKIICKNNNNNNN